MNIQQVWSGTVMFMVSHEYVFGTSMMECDDVSISELLFVKLE